MTKIPVVQTAANAYRFTLENYLRVLGVTWVPMVSFILIGSVLLPLMLRMQQAAISRNPALMMANLGPMLLLECVLAALLISMVVGITKLVLGRELKFPYFHLSLGRDFWRLVSADILILLMAIGFVIVLSVVLGIVIGVVAVSMAGSHPEPVQLATQTGRLGFVIIVAIYAVMTFFAIRLAFLLPPITLCEKRIGIGRNWILTKSNFWRIVGLIILIMLPLLALGCIQFVLMTVFGGPEMNYFGSFASPQARVAFSASMVNFYARYWYIFVPAWIVMAPILYGPLMGTSVLVYRALVPDVPTQAA